MSEIETPVTICAGKATEFTSQIEEKLSAHKVRLGQILRETLSADDLQNNWTMLSSGFDDQHASVRVRYAAAATQLTTAVQEHWAVVCQLAITEARLFAQASLTVDTLITPFMHLNGALNGLLNSREHELHELLSKTETYESVMAALAVISHEGLEDIPRSLRTRLEDIRKQML